MTVCKGVVNHFLDDDVAVRFIGLEERDQRGHMGRGE
jgi:hypothetical protein